MQRIDATEAAQELLRRARELAEGAAVWAEGYEDAVDELLHDAEVDSWADASRGFEGAAAAFEELREAVERLR